MHAQWIMSKGIIYVSAVKTVDSGLLCEMSASRVISLLPFGVPHGTNISDKLYELSVNFILFLRKFLHSKLWYIIKGILLCLFIKKLFPLQFEVKLQIDWIISGYDWHLGMMYHVYYQQWPADFLNCLHFRVKWAMWPTFVKSRMNLRFESENDEDTESSRQRDSCFNCNGVKYVVRKCISFHSIEILESCSLWGSIRRCPLCGHMWKGLWRSAVIQTLLDHSLSVDNGKHYSSDRDQRRLVWWC